jgi:hypothetical protein
MYLCHADEGLVEVFDRFGRVFRRLVADITDAPGGKVFHVCYRILGEVFPDIILSEFWWQATNKDTRRLHSCIVLSAEACSEGDVAISLK